MISKILRFLNCIVLVAGVTEGEQQFLLLSFYIHVEGEISHINFNLRPLGTLRTGCFGKISPSQLLILLSLSLSGVWFD